MFVLFPVAIAGARLLWRRASEPASRGLPAPDETARRLAEVQQSLDAMAVEIERIAEGQRFVTKLMSERPVDAIGAGAQRAPLGKPRG